MKKEKILNQSYLKIRRHIWIWKKWKRLEENNLYYDDNYIKTAYLGLLTCKAGLHPLFIGKRGSGLTRFSNLIASNYSIKEKEIVIEKQRKKINSLLLCSETTIDDLIGCFQSKTYKKNEKGDT